MLRKLYAARIPALILIGAGVIVAMSRSEKIKIDTGVKRFTAIIFPAFRHIRGRAPLKITARAIFGFLRLDMTQAALIRSDQVKVDVSCIVGRIEIIVPKDWEVQAGRVELARYIKFEGSLPATGSAPAGQADQGDKNLVVINALGWLGFVVVQRH